MQNPIDFVLSRKPLLVFILANATVLASALVFGFGVKEMLEVYLGEFIILGFSDIIGIMLSRGIRSVHGERPPLSTVLYELLANIIHAMIFLVLYVMLGVALINMILDDLDASMRLAYVIVADIAVLLASHAFLFYHNYIKAKEYLNSTYADFVSNQVFRMSYGMLLFVLSNVFASVTMAFWAIGSFAAIKMAADWYSSQRNQ